VKLSDHKLAQALTNLRGNSDFRVFMEALKEDARAETTRSLKLEGAPCHRAQGAALKLLEIEEGFAAAPDALVKINKQG
jgi:hypothetical protein